MPEAQAVAVGEGGRGVDAPVADERAVLAPEVLDRGIGAPDHDPRVPPGHPRHVDQDLHARVPAQDALPLGQGKDLVLPQEVGPARAVRRLLPRSRLRCRGEGTRLPVERVAEAVDGPDEVFVLPSARRSWATSVVRLDSETNVRGHSRSRIAALATAAGRRSSSSSSSSKAFGSRWTGSPPRVSRRVSESKATSPNRSCIALLPRIPRKSSAGPVDCLMLRAQFPGCKVRRTPGQAAPAAVAKGVADAPRIPPLLRLRLDPGRRVALLGRPAAAEAPPDPDRRELHLVFVDLCDTRAPARGHGTLREIQGLLEPAGMRVTGRTASPAENQATGGVFVVLMPFDPSRPRTHPSAGVARRENGRQLTVWAFPPWVAGGLGLDLGQASRWTFRQRVQFERAMAVVVVHELAHALAGAEHRPDGLMSARLGRAQLLDPTLFVDADLHPAFRAGVAAIRAAADPQASVVEIASSVR